jgi:hypothetical protein
MMTYTRHPSAAQSSNYERSQLGHPERLGDRERFPDLGRSLEVRSLSAGVEEMLQRPTEHSSNALAGGLRHPRPPASVEENADIIPTHDHGMPDL